MNGREFGFSYGFRFVCLYEGVSVDVEVDSAVGNTVTLTVLAELND